MYAYTGVHVHVHKEAGRARPCSWWVTGMYAYTGVHVHVHKEAGRARPCSWWVTGGEGVRGRMQ